MLLVLRLLLLRLLVGVRVSPVVVPVVVVQLLHVGPRRLLLCSRV